MPKIVRVGPDEIELGRPPNVKISDADFEKLASSLPQSAVEFIESAGLPKILPGDIIVSGDGTISIANDALYSALKKRLEETQAVIFGNTGCLNVICGIF